MSERVEQKVAKVAKDARDYDLVSALVYSFAGAQAAAGPYNDLTEFVLRQRARLADQYRVPLELAGRLLDGVHRFHGRPAGQRWRQIEKWRNSRVGVHRDFVRFYESLATLALHSRLPEGPWARGSEGPWVGASEDRIIGLTDHRLTDPQSPRHAEIVVIGSGPGGSITACLLAEAGRDVVLIEEGPFAGLGSTPAFSTAEMEEKYRNGGLTVALGRTKIAYVEGRCVGGGSEINSGLYHRTPPEVLERWRKEFAVEGLTEADLREHFEACERDVSVSGLAGPAPAASLKLHDGASRLGWKSLEVPRWFRDGKRQSMTQTFIPRYLAAGGKLLPETRVDRIRRSGGKWELVISGSNRIVSAESVFISGGATQTPALLRRSGITHSIGDSLRLHPTVKLVARFREEVNAAGMGVPVHQVKEFAPRLSFGCSISSPPFLALGLLDHRDALRSVATDWPHMATYYAMITGEGSGTVRALPGLRDPVIRYTLTRADRRDLADGLRKLSEAMFASGATEVYPALPDGRMLRDGAAVEKMPEEFPAGAAGLMTIHLFSSCPMGEQRDRCATDSFGRVHGHQGLYIADASLLPGRRGVNPQGTIMAIARRNVMRFLQKG